MTSLLVIMASDYNIILLRTGLLDYFLAHFVCISVSSLYILWQEFTLSHSVTYPRLWVLFGV